ncbi:MAG: PspC domain-containing protein [Glaciihabitans sp.]
MTTFSPPRQHRPALVLPRHAVLGGVSAALATHLGWRRGLVRTLFVMLTVFGGAGALLYLWLWALVPLDPTGDDTAAVTRRIPVAAVLVAIAGIAALVGFDALDAGADTQASQALIVVTICAGGAVAWILGFDRVDPTRSRRYEVTVRMIAVLLLIVAGAVALSTRPNALNAILGVVMVVTAVAVLVAPNVVTLWSDLMAERAARVRQQQRAEIAAHLHDSVLQTLALIQNRAGASSEVARIARAQERELRDWLFAGDEPAAADLATELRGVAAAIELDYAVRIDLVAVGESTQLASSAVVAAAREAMLNAARHAGGEVSVYLETSPGAVDVFIRDRGPGVDLDALPADRLGIRESIIGRMRRAGGTATVRAGAEVHLHLEVPHD